MEKLEPALSQKLDLTEIPAEEFQRVLTVWLEEKGLLANLKSYMKFQMINMLRNTVMGKNLRKKSSEVFSLAQQALHLIVAEYLWQNQCQFTFSLFSSEVNLTNVMPDSKLFSFMNERTDNVKMFDKNNVVHILELVGFSKQNAQFPKLLRLYFEKNNTLLNCLVNILSENYTDIQDPEKCTEFEQKDIEDDFLQNVLKAFRTSHLQTDIQKQLIHHIKLCYDLKVKTFESQCVKLVNKFKKELSGHESKIKKLNGQKKCLEKQIKKIQSENLILRDQSQKIPENTRNVLVEHYLENINPNVCNQEHCGDECKKNVRLCGQYKREIDRLKTENKNQKIEIEQLLSRCNALVDEINGCQNKISLINIKMQEQDSGEINGQMRSDSLSFSSDNNTEEIVLQAKEKLKLLEEESTQLDLKFKALINKHIL
ncbi:uncharacterized protein LOC143204467 [Rhynchophorus ferrugineus]|uniref:uncharacterized protein LOC143204467 n=1 Tax=Rhynchophorus ferrugineus TaxID=354439 RepID=UPI003FCE8684